MKARIARIAGLLSTVVLVCAGVAKPAATPAPTASRPAPVITTFGSNALEWNRRLGLTEMRRGCSRAPSFCSDAASALAASQNVGAIFLAINEDPSTAADYASQYSRLSAINQSLEGISFDDFESMYRHWYANHGIAPAALLRSVVQNAKSANPLQIGVTIYEDELTSPFLQDAKLPPDIRRAIDFVFLYIHYRANGPAYAGYVARVKQLFPNAKIIAGSYAYDRIDYLPCSQSSAKHCTADQELSYYADSIGVQARMAASGQIAGIEFYPAYFGQEERWSGWETSRNCQPARRNTCISNTKAMRESAFAALHAAGIR